MQAINDGRVRYLGKGHEDKYHKFCERPYVDRVKQIWRCQYFVNVEDFTSRIILYDYQTLEVVHVIHSPYIYFEKLWMNAKQSIFIYRDDQGQYGIIKRIQKQKILESSSINK